jgi:hypothetical protein
MLNKIQDLTGARIDIPRSTQGADGAPPDRGKSHIPVSLKGTCDAAKKCKKIIQDLLAEEGEDFIEHNGTIPTDSIHEIVGPKGSIIIKIKDGCGLKIIFIDGWTTKQSIIIEIDHCTK